MFDPEHDSSKEPSCTEPRLRAQVDVWSRISVSSAEFKFWSSDVLRYKRRGGDHSGLPLRPQKLLPSMVASRRCRLEQRLQRMTSLLTTSALEHPEVSYFKHERKESKAEKL